jgi:hypothetical protein
MPEDPANQRQPYAAARADICEGVPEVVDANVFDLGTRDPWRRIRGTAACT